jgi:hypothetical protein
LLAGRVASHVGRTVCFSQNKSSSRPSRYSCFYLSTKYLALSYIISHTKCISGVDAMSQSGRWGLGTYFSQKTPHSMYFWR